MEEEIKEEPQEEVKEEAGGEVKTQVKKAEKPKGDSNIYPIIGAVILVAIIIVGLSYLSKSQPADEGMGGGGGEPVVEKSLKDPDEKTLDEARQEIINLMEDDSLTLDYVGYSYNPTNFSVAIDMGEGQFSVLEKWMRPVYRFQQKEYTDSDCDVYQYEVDADTLEVIEVSLVRPNEIQELLNEPDGEAEIKAMCIGNDSISYPLMPHDQIEMRAMDFLARGISNIDEEKSQFTYISSKPGSANPLANEWIWQDDTYELPEGLDGGVYPKPTVRIIMGASGKLMYYFNSSELYE